MSPHSSHTKILLTCHQGQKIWKENLMLGMMPFPAIASLLVLGAIPKAWGFLKPLNVHHSLINQYYYVNVFHSKIYYMPDSRGNPALEHTLFCSGKINKYFLWRNFSLFFSAWKFFNENSNCKFLTKTFLISITLYVWKTFFHVQICFYVWWFNQTLSIYV